MRLRLSSRADADLESIWQYVARDDPRAADRLEERLHAAMQMLAEFPGVGHTRPDVANPQYRFWTVLSYLIAYRADQDTVTILRVLHGARDFRELLD